MSVRLPSHAVYAAQVDKEHEWLPKLAPHLPLPIPTPLAKGEPCEDFPLPWSIYGWIKGEIATTADIDDTTGLAHALAAFLNALHRIDASGGPPAGMHSHFRGGALTGPAFHPDRERRSFDVQTREAMAALGDRVDAFACTEVWEAALETEWRTAPVWVHGDVATTNLIVRDGQLSAVIDFGCSGVGDPACDLVIAWTFFSGRSREAFREGMPSLDDGTWARGRGWALWKALLVLARDIDTGTEIARISRRVVEEVVEDHSVA